MDNDLLTEAQALDLVYSYMTTEGGVSTTQEILDSGLIPGLKGFTVRPCAEAAAIHSHSSHPSRSSVSPGAHPFKRRDRHGQTVEDGEHAVQRTLIHQPAG